MDTLSRNTNPKWTQGRMLNKEERERGGKKNKKERKKERTKCGDIVKDKQEREERERWVEDSVRKTREKWRTKKIYKVKWRWIKKSKKRWKKRKR